MKYPATQLSAPQYHRHLRTTQATTPNPRCVARGFTLVELLVVIAIVSILTAIAIPQYNRYKERAFDLRALQDLRSVAIAEEAYFADWERYLACADSGCTALPGIARISEGVQVAFEVSDTDFIGESQHILGSGRTYRWDSSAGGLIE